MKRDTDKRRVGARAVFAVLALGTIAVGLAVHRGATWLPAPLRDATGDALWAMMICWWIGALAPALHPARRAGIALGICWAVEFSQLYHAPVLDAWRRTVLGQLVLGSDYDPRDLAAYVVGVLVALGLEALGRWQVRGRRA